MYYYYASEMVLHLSILIRQLQNVVKHTWTACVKYTIIRGICANIQKAFSKH